MGVLKGYKQATFYMRPALKRALHSRAKHSGEAEYELLDRALTKFLRAEAKKDEAKKSEE